MFQYSLNGKGMIYGPNRKRITDPMECNLMVYSPNVTGIVFYERLFFNVVFFMVKDKKYSISDKIPIKISFMHSIKST